MHKNKLTPVLANKQPPNKKLRSWISDGKPDFLTWRGGLGKLGKTANKLKRGRVEQHRKAQNII